MSCKALLIGNNIFIGAAPLGCAEEDAKAFATALRSHCGFTDAETRLMIHGNGVPNDPFQRTIESRLEELYSPNALKQPLDLLIVGYWGHGVISSTDGKLYLYAADTNTEKLVQTAIPMESIQNAIVRSQAKNALLILDCCQSYGRGSDDNVWSSAASEQMDWEPVLSNWASATNKQMNLIQRGTRWLFGNRVLPRDPVSHRVDVPLEANAITPRRFATIIACSAGEKAYEYQGKGVFTSQILQGIEAEKTSYAALTEYLQQNVPLAASNIGCQQNPTFYYKGAGDFSINMRRNDKSKETIPRQTAEIDNPENIVVNQYVVEDFEIVPEKVALERTVIHFPSIRGEQFPFPEELDQSRAELLGLNRALFNFGDNAETASSRAREVVRKAKEQLDSIEKKRNDAWDKMGLSPETRTGMEEALKKNPLITLSDVFNLKPSELTVAEFGYCFDVEKKRLEAERIADAASKRFTELSDALRKKLIEGRKTAKTNYLSRVDQFCQDTIDSVLKTCQGYEQDDADLPQEDLSRILLPYFDDCPFAFTDDFLWNTIRKRWEARPSANSWNYAAAAGTRRGLNIDGIEYAFHYCPAGRYTIGSPESEEGRDSDETQHDVIFSCGYWMLETQVTQEMWEKVMGTNPSDFKGANLPVESVSWDKCQEFIKKLNDKGVAPKGWVFSLPTEAEWEVAARAGSTTAFPWGATLNGDKANCDGNNPYGTTTKGKYIGQTCAVKSYSPNAWGLYDTAGNVHEWCLDKYGEYPKTVETDYVGKSGSSRVLRGGSWNSYAQYCRSSYRNYYDPSYCNSGWGCRCSLARALVRQQQLQ